MGDFLRRYERLVQALVGVLSVLIVIASGWFEAGSRPQAALLGIGISALTTVFLTAAERVLQGPVPRTGGGLVDDSLSTRLTDSGIHAIYHQLGDEAIFYRIRTAKSVDLLYNTAATTIKRYWPEIEEALRNQGCNVRIAIAHEENPVWGIQEYTDALCPATEIPKEIAGSVREIERRVKELRDSGREPRRGHLEVRKYRAGPTMSLLIVDGQFLRHIPYLPYAHSSEVPVFDFNRGRDPRVFTKYTEAFDRVWLRSKDSVAFTARFPAPRARSR